MTVYESREIPGGPFNSTSIVEDETGLVRGNKAIDAAFAASMLQCLISDGITEKTDFAVLPGGNFAISVEPGCAWARGYMARSDEAELFHLSPGESYTVCVRFNIFAGEATVTVFTDDNGTSPVRSDGTYDLVLARIKIPDSAPYVSSSMITDLRGNADYCGYVTSKLDRA